jgi:glycosyltransferase involved in cell wall biosynthesis
VNADPPAAPAAHIVILMHDFSTGGTERIAIRMANRWVLAGRRVTIMCGSDKGPARALVSSAIAVVQSEPEIVRSHLSRVQLSKPFAHAIEGLAPDLIFAPGNFHLPVASLLGRRLGPARPPIICKISNPLRRRRRGSLRQWIFERILRSFAKSIEGFIAMSDALHQEARDVLGTSWISMIPEPILDEDAAILARPNAPPMIVCIGRLVAQKNFLLAVRAFAQIAPYSRASLMILGEGRQRASLQREIDRLGLTERILLAGHVADIRPTLALARLLLISSDFEGYPAVAVEALAAGRAIVTTDCSPALREILSHPSFGRIVASDPMSLADGMAEMLDAPPPDQGMLAKLLDQHRIERASTHYLDLFDLTVRHRSLRQDQRCRD